MYLYETHMHTSEASQCASSAAQSQVAYYKKMGFDGVIITDHFLGGSTTVPAHLPWAQRVELFYQGYALAKQAGDKLGLTVLFG